MEQPASVNKSQDPDCQLWYFLSDKDISFFVMLTDIEPFHFGFA